MKLKQTKPIKFLPAIIAGFLFAGYLPVTAYADEPDIDDITVESSEVIESAEISIIADVAPIVTAVPDEDIPKGNGSLVEDVTDDEVNRQFITVKTKNGNIFYIVIDKNSKTENVYFLNAVDEYDLLAFAEKFPEEVLAEIEAEKTETAEGGEGETVEDETGEGEAKPEQKKPDKPKKDDTPADSGGLTANKIISIIIALLFIAVVVYFKLIKPKKGKSNKNSGAYADEEEEDETVNEDSQNENQEQEEQEDAE